FFFSSRRRHTRSKRDWSSDVCSSDLKVGVVVGSIRKGSFSGRVAKALVNLLPEDYEATYLQIDHLPLYNQDSDEDSPQEYLDFREVVEAQDAFIFVTPEHNRSVPAA